MTWAETTEVPWTVDARVAIGFSPGDARLLAPRLPLVEARLLAEVEGGTATSAWLPDVNPAAVLIWLSHGPGARQACDLARMGRGVLDLIVILDSGVLLGSQLRLPARLSSVQRPDSSERGP